ncbi:hypothetical protein DFH09DRAFT_580174 [Mycena vulgaris]|nr:hypothetical protein DFH09DRAFT_580174 [Mycena vulgaris]
MPAFSLPALVVALVASFSPAIVFQISHPLQLQGGDVLPQIPLPMFLTTVLTLPMLDINAALDALEGSFLAHLPFPMVLSPSPLAYTRDATKFIGTTINNVDYTVCFSPSKLDCILASPFHTLSTLFLPMVLFILYAFASPLHHLESIPWSSSLT